MRYLGMVRTLCIEPEAKRLLLIEMLARTVKNILRGRLREAFKQGGHSKYKHPKVVVCEMLNVVFGTSDNANQFWKEELLPKMLLWFPCERPKELKAADTTSPTSPRLSSSISKEAPKKRDPIYYNLFGLKKTPNMAASKGKEKEEEAERETTKEAKKEIANTKSKRKRASDTDDDELEAQKQLDDGLPRECAEKVETRCSESDLLTARGRNLLSLADVFPLLNRVQQLAGIKISDSLLAQIQTILQPFLPVSTDSPSPTPSFRAKKSSYRQRGFTIGSFNSNAKISLAAMPASPVLIERQDVDLAIFTKEDIHKIVARVKEMPIVDELEGRAALLNARYVCFYSLSCPSSLIIKFRAISERESFQSSQVALRDRYLDQAISAYQDAIKGFNRNSIAMIGLANVYLECALFKADPVEQQKLRNSAFTRLADAVECTSTYHAISFSSISCVSQHRQSSQQTSHPVEHSRCLLGQRLAEEITGCLLLFLSTTEGEIQ